MIEYKTHIQNIGWSEPVEDGETAGTTGQGLRLEGIIINSDDNLEYQVHVQNIGWQPFVKRGELAGTEGQGLRMEAFRIRLIDPKKGRHIWYRVHVENVGWTDYAIDGAICGSVGESLRIEAIEIRIVDEGENDDFDQWYDESKKCRIGDVVFTVTTEEAPTLTCEITDKPVEGGNISDHGEFKPLDLKVSGVICGDDSEEKKETIMQYMKNVEILRYVGIDTATNVAITSFPIVRSSRIANGFSFTMTLKEMRLATGVVTVIDEAYVATQVNDLKNGGLQAVVTT